MSHSSEHNSEDNKSSHKDTEYHSESEEGSTTSEEDMFLSIQYPSPPNFPTPYLCNWDFRDPDKGLKYIMNHFNLETIHNSLHRFPDLSLNFIYSNTFVDSDYFLLLEHYINKSIHDWNALHQKGLELHTRHLTSDKLNPFIIQCIL